MTGPLAKPFLPLNRRVVAWVLLYSALFTLVMTAVLISIDYRDEREDVLNQLRFAAASHRKSLANSLWDLDMDAARLQLDGLASFPMVGHVVLTTTIGQTVQAGMGDDDSSRQTPVDLPSWEETLVNPHDPTQVVGHLQLFADRQAFLRRIEAGAIRILAGEAVKGLVLGMLIAWLIARLVTRHLSDMASQLALMNPAVLGHSLSLRRKERMHHDELDQLRDAFNQLNLQLAAYLKEKQGLEEELRNHRDRLSDLVNDRTRSLERLRGFHSLIIRVLTHVINLPPGHANDAVDHGMAAFGDYFGAKRCMLYVYDRQMCGFTIANVWPLASGCVDDLFLSNEGLPPGLLADRRSRIWLCANADDVANDAVSNLFGSDAYTAVGVEVKSNTVGLLCLVGRAIPQSDENASLLELAARVTASMLDHKAAQRNLLDTQNALQNANRELHSLSRHDPLTALANRRHFDELKEIEFRRAMRVAWPLSVLMCDIDEFKRYNDTYGHAQGDRCLITIAECLAPLFNRAGELVARLGGEEFAVLLPNTSAEHALALAERVRQAIWEKNLPHSSSTVADRVTLSVGVACLKPGIHQNFDALLQDADRALYRAKSNRNRTVVAK